MFHLNDGIVEYRRAGWVNIHNDGIVEYRRAGWVNIHTSDFPPPRYSWGLTHNQPPCRHIQPPGHHNRPHDTTISRWGCTICCWVGSEVDPE